MHMHHGTCPPQLLIHHKSNSWSKRRGQSKFITKCQWDLILEQCRIIIIIKYYYFRFEKKGSLINFSQYLTEINPEPVSCGLRLESTRDFSISRNCSRYTTCLPSIHQPHIWHIAERVSPQYSPVCVYEFQLNVGHYRRCTYLHISMYVYRYVGQKVIFVLIRLQVSLS